MTPREQIRRFISESFFVEDFGDDDSFLQQGIVDSLGMMELVTFIERQFGLKLAETELVPENLDSVARVCAFVERKRAAAAQAA